MSSEAFRAAVQSAVGVIPDDVAAREVLVLGAGVIGLTAAAALAIQGHGVRIWSKDVTPHTTSDASGAMWLPFACGPPESVARWARTSLEAFHKLAATDRESGVFELQAQLLYDLPVVDPPWSNGVETYRSGPPAKGFSDRYEHMQTAYLPMIDVTHYMPYLSARVKELGVPVEVREVRSLTDAIDSCATVVNCTGLGSRALCSDPLVRPVRGQTVRIKKTGRQVAIADDEGSRGMAYIFPRIDDVLLGGTAQEDDWRLEEDPADTEAIISRCRVLDPSLGDVEIQSVGVGLRPYRADVRVEIERLAGGLVVHNYGHGGGGYTLSWGCAADVARMLQPT
jgi:D-amino-acid oxidase